MRPLFLTDQGFLTESFLIFATIPQLFLKECYSNLPAVLIIATISLHYQTH